MRPPRWLALSALLLSAVALLATAAVHAQNAVVQFTDATAAAGIKFVHASGATPEKYMMETFGSGVAWIDYDGDGRQDLLFVNGDPRGANALYHNNGDGTFSDVTARAGVGGQGAAYRTGAAVGDVDGDGDLDLFVAAYGPNVMYANNGDGTFTDVTAEAGVAGGAQEWTSSAGFFDADNDGDLDLYVTNYLAYRKEDNPYCGFDKPGYRTYCDPTTFDGTPDRLYMNDGRGHFSDVSKAAGIANPAGKGLGVVFCDVDGDGWQDIYVANDLVRNFLYRNNGDGTFKDIAYAAGVGFDANGKAQAGMGVDCADVTGDGKPDLFVTNFSEELNTLYENEGDLTFQDVSVKAGLGSGFGPLGFGTKLFDADNDGDLDIYVTNGHVIDNIAMYKSSSTYEQRDLFYLNSGGRFEDVTDRAGAALKNVRVGRGLAVADYDNDGDLDIAIASLGRRAVLLRNGGIPGRHWLEIQARGRKSNTFGFGARIEVQTPGGRLVREISNVASYLSANDARLHIGLGSVARVPRIEVIWPGGQRQVLTDVQPDRVLVVDQADAAAEKPLR